MLSKVVSLFVVFVQQSTCSVLVTRTGRNYLGQAVLRVVTVPVGMHACTRPSINTPIPTKHKENIQNPAIFSWQINNIKMFVTLFMNDSLNWLMQPSTINLHYLPTSDPRAKTRHKIENRDGMDIHFCDRRTGIQRTDIVAGSCFPTNLKMCLAL